MNNHGRLKPELMSIIGMFVNALPMRCQINSNHSFHEFVKYVDTIATQTFEHSYFSLQRILAQHPHISRPTFLDVFFAFVSFPTEDNHDEVTVGGVPIYIMPYSIQINTDETATKGQHDVVITKDAFIDLIYIGTRLHHYDCLLEGNVCLSNILYKNQCQDDELIIVYGSILIQQIFEQSSFTAEWTRTFPQFVLNIIKTNGDQNLMKNLIEMTFLIHSPLVT
ncbi:unnamed protein product [Adineta steineri]|uniref:Condensation domain-containing protein n=1 Tax=Adineta steineri TaxID=433720 RepID=A0A814FR68_9BILA|nr:unnamed protein product [Adineta steineri]CAF3766806.1 unnamed protein product [Adineta steineri]CAF4099669.1 unnamed protein product [Adineta steineri]